jgi:hypothetical protein
MSFLRPKTPAQTPAPSPPAIEDTAAKQQEYQDMLRQRRGRASAILRQQGEAAPLTAAKQLLGQ